ncbi:MAG: decarboxylating NADP(+)-dependent phosphogluconate dehydrogenase [Treponema sp.]|jgi:6-phosphogluconate dehydrogenase|nr:decarboxylating NADP(+)-dependent phosphogluconate dehydrogenase [Treponema sp.]
MKKNDIGVIGLAVMGENLILNIESKGFSVSIYNRTAQKVSQLLETRARGKNIQGAYSLEEFVDQLERPRKVMLLVKAGDAVEDLINQIIPLLEPGDIIIDGGNSNYLDTIRRTELVESKGLLYIGTGVSGGEEGALRGPSIMPGGSKQAWPHVKPIFQAIAAKVDGSPCCDWVGDNGSGHYVKMIHNGIEYGDIQLICEAYHLMRDLLDMDSGEIASKFAYWNQTDLSSFLIEITADILNYKNENGIYEVDCILDRAGHKGTGIWTGVTALELGVPLTLICESVFSRILSSMKDDRVNASKVITKAAPVFNGDKNAFIDDIGKALLASKIVSYAQGFELLKAASASYGWELDYGSIALMWRGGCIIRSVFLGTIKEAFERDPGLKNLMLALYFRQKLEQSLPSWRRVASTAILNGIPAPAFCSALAYFDGYTCANLPANLLQAMRDYFGAHLYERIDAPRGQFFHTNWTGKGGTTTAAPPS